MPGNPKDSKWYSLPRAERKRKKIELTLGDEAMTKLNRLAGGAKSGRRSEVVEKLILEAEEDDGE